MHDDLRECYRILDLEPGVSFDEVKQAYRDQVRVWHPDRFRSDPKLQTKAQERLKLINLSYERLCQEAAAEPGRKVAEDAISKAAASQTAGSAPEPPRAKTSAAQVQPESSPQAPPKHGSKVRSPTHDERIALLNRWVQAASWAVGGLVMLLLVWAVSQKPRGAESNKQNAPNQGNSASLIAKTLQQRAKDGEADAQQELGYMYSSGKDVPKDDAKAFELFGKAASQGEPFAQRNLGVYFEQGWGTPKDDAKAFEWYRRAALQGHPQAQYDLARMYADGTAIAIAGDPKDPDDSGSSIGSFVSLEEPGSVRAYAWLNLAAAKNVDGAKALRDQVGKRLTTEGRIQGQKLSAELADEIRTRKTKLPLEPQKPKTKSDAADGEKPKNARGLAMSDGEKFAIEQIGQVVADKFRQYLAGTKAIPPDLVNTVAAMRYFPVEAQQREIQRYVEQAQQQVITGLVAKQKVKSDSMTPAVRERTQRNALANFYCEKITAAPNKEEKQKLIDESYAAQRDFKLQVEQAQQEMSPRLGIKPPEANLRPMLRSEAPTDSGPRIPSRIVPPRITTGIQLNSIPRAMQWRFDGGRKQAMAQNSMMPKSEMAVIKGLRWLQQNQNPDGSWGESTRGGMTGLALLCLLGHGATPESQEFGLTVNKAVQWILDNGAKNEGRLHMASSFNKNGVYEHAICAYALGEYYAITHDERVKEVFKQSIDYIVQGQGPGGGWMYSYDKTADDLDVSGWQIQALKAAHLGQFNLPGVDQALDKALAYIERVKGAKGGYGYRGPADDYSVTGVGILCGLFWKGERGLVRKGMEWALDETEKTYPVKYKSEHADLYAWYYYTQACLMFGGSAWTKWNHWFQDEICDVQNTDGSWPVPGGKSIGIQSSASKAGQVYRTTLCILMLEVFYRYMPSTPG